MDSCVMKVQVKLTMLIPAKTQFYIYPFRKYLPHLNARLQDGTELPILPYTELSRLLGRNITLDEIKKIATDLTKGVIEEEVLASENFALIILPYRESDYYEELELNWKEPIGHKQSNDILTLDVPLNRQFSPTEESSLYVEIKVSEKYELTELPTTFSLDDEHPETIGIDNPRFIYPLRRLEDTKDYEVILKDKRNYVLRFGRKFPQTIQIQYKVGVPLMVRNWAWFGILAGGLLIPFNLYIFVAVIESFKFSAALTAGIVAAMIGLRIILFHDVELMARWNWVYIALISANLLILVGLAVQCTSQCF